MVCLGVWGVFGIRVVVMGEGGVVGMVCLGVLECVGGWCCDGGRGSKRLAEGLIDGE